MRTFGRTILYSWALCALFAYLSFRVYKSPEQVRRRVEDFLRGVLNSEVRVEGCEERFLEALKIASLVVPASPPLDERAVAVLEDIRLDPSARRPFRRLLGEPEGEDGTLRSIRARRASLFLDRVTGEAPGSDAERWNFADLFRGDAAGVLLGGARAKLVVDRLEVQVQDLRGQREKTRWRVAARDVEARAQGPGGSIEADLEDGPHWSGGHAKAVWLPNGEVEVEGELNEVREAESWLPLLGERARAIWETFRPAGTWDLEIEKAQFPPGGRARWKAITRHYDTTLLLGPSAVEFRHLSGSIVATEEAVSLGGDGPGTRPVAELLGVPVELSGTVAAERMDLKPRLPSLSLDGLLAVEGDARAGASAIAAVAALRPQGRVEGEAVWTWTAPGPETLQGELRFQELAFADLALLAGGSGKISFESRGPAGDATSGKHAGRGKGKAALDLPCAGLGKLHGEAEFSWGASGVDFKLYDFAVVEPAPGAAAPGKLFGTVRVAWDLTVTFIDLRWLEIPLATGLLRAREIGGTLMKEPASEPAKGSGHLAAPVVPAGALAPDLGDLVFESGKWLAVAGADVIEVTSLKLEGAERALRARGRVSLLGEVDLVVLLDQGPTHRALCELPDESGPGAWKEAARGSYRAFRVTGTVSGPRAREIGGADPAFFNGK
jgi:hypothetical protein